MIIESSATILIVVETKFSVRNGPGPRQGPAGGLPRALDGTGRHNAVHTRP